MDAISCIAPALKDSSTKLKSVRFFSAFRLMRKSHIVPRGSRSGSQRFKRHSGRDVSVCTGLTSDTYRIGSWNRLKTRNDDQ